MYNENKTYFSPDTTHLFVKIIDRMTYEHMYMCRLELAYQYATLRFPGEDMLWNTKGFWNWFLRVWQNNDVSILDAMKKNNHHKLSEAVYLSYQQIYFDNFLPYFWNGYDGFVDRKLVQNKNR